MKAEAKRPAAAGLALAACLAALPAASARAAAGPAEPAPAPETRLIPYPAKLSRTGGAPFAFTADGGIAACRLVPENEVEALREVLRRALGRDVRRLAAPSGRGGDVCLRIDPAIAAPEGYRLSIGAKKIEIAGKGAAGVFYGIQTLGQLLPPPGAGPAAGGIVLPAMEIEDAPRYAYRSLMLDPARHFLPSKDVRRFIDVMARYKYNSLHLHLTDDVGWRIEIKKYPLLTARGAFRKENSGPQGPHNGFYTQDEMRGLIAYAAARHVEIVPELDMPGHTVAAIHAYPELGCAHLKDAPIRFGATYNRMLCAAKEETYRFCGDVLKELADLFPAKRIHLGGDEAALRENWEKCPDCRALMKREGIASPAGLMARFFSRIGGMIHENGKEMMLWCELDNIRAPAHRYLFPYAKDTVLYTWRLGLSPTTVRLTKEAGNRLALSPGEHCYFDYTERDGSVKGLYGWDTEYGLPPGERGHIIGVAGLLWGERMQDIDRVFYMAYPRAIALAEAGWSPPETRDWARFRRGLDAHLERFKADGIPFRAPAR